MIAGFEYSNGNFPSAASMDVHKYFQFGLDGPFTEETNLFSSTPAHELHPYPAYSTPFPPVLLSTPDAAMRPTNEHAWLSSVKGRPVADNIGFDSGGHLPHQSPTVVTQNRHLNLCVDMMTAAISTDSFQFGGDDSFHAPWRQMCSLSSDNYLNDAMPQLISDSTVQQPCLYTSSSDCPHEADSSGSSERGGPSSRSCWVESPSDEMSWRISDGLEENLGGSTAGFRLDGLREDSFSVEVSLDTLDSGRHALSSLVNMPGPTGDCIPFGPVSWMPPSTIQSGNRLMATGLRSQQSPSLDSFGASLSTDSNGASPYKRQRASYTLENTSAGPFGKPAIAALSSCSTWTKSLGSDCLATSLNVPDASCEDSNVSWMQTLSLPTATLFEAVRGLATKRDRVDDDVKSQRKQNAESIEPQSVAARHRRRKISERVRVLERLIPGGNKMDTASMLDESIEYVKFLQLQVQLLESLGEMSNGNSVTSTPSLSKENIGRGKREGLYKRTSSSFGSTQVPQSCTTMQLVRPAASPFILSEILQQQLFKQKLCLVSLRQCPPTSRPLASTSSLGSISDGAA